MFQVAWRLLSKTAVAATDCCIGSKVQMALRRRPRLRGNARWQSAAALGKPWRTWTDMGPACGKKMAHDEFLLVTALADRDFGGASRVMPLTLCTVMLGWCSKFRRSVGSDFLTTLFCPLHIPSPIFGMLSKLSCFGVFGAKHSKTKKSPITEWCTAPRLSICDAAVFMMYF